MPAAPDVLVAVDPGTSVVCFATFEGGRLTLVSALRRESVEEMIGALRDLRTDGTGPGEVVVEVPQVYPSSRAKGNPNDLIRVALAAGGAAVAVGGVVRLVRPHEWKGSVPKEIHNRRTLAKLDREEVEAFEGVDLPPYLRHNALDAVGIGLWRLGR